MRVGQRLFLAVLPAIVGLLTVTALVYWGEYSRQAPEWLVIAAVVAALGSAVLAWRNTRYVAQRVEQLAARRGERDDASVSFRRASELLGMALHPQGSRDQGIDELDRIELLVDRLSDALAQSRTAQAAQGELIAQRQREYETLAAQAVEGAMHQLEEVRLPLHILLENRFGELNENQEEMIGAARNAAETVDAALLRLREIVRLDLGTVTLRKERVRLQDVVHAILPPFTTAASDQEVTVQADLPPTLPAFVADRGRLQEALSVILHEILRQSPSGATLSLEGEDDRRELRLVIRGGGVPEHGEPLAYAERLIRAHAGSVETLAGRTVVHLPRSTREDVPLSISRSP